MNIMYVASISDGKESFTLEPEVVQKIQEISINYPLTAETSNLSQFSPKKARANGDFNQKNLC